MDIDRVISELRVELELIDQAILSLELVVAHTRLGPDETRAARPSGESRKYQPRVRTKFHQQPAVNTASPSI